MEGFLDSPEVLDTRQFLIAVKRLADSLAFGTDRSPYIGSGLEYHQSRPYQFGDSIKAIDWRVTARTGKVFVKEYEAIKRLPVWILVDTSASMTIGSMKRTKYSVAVHVAGGLALASLDAIRPVGFLSVGGRGLMRPESLSKDQVHGWLHALRRFRFDEPTQLGKRVGELAARLPQRSQIIILSDLHEPESLPALKLAAQVHDCSVIHLIDPSEMGFPGTGFVRGQEAESGREVIASGNRAWTDPQGLRELLKTSRIDSLSIDVSQPYVARLRQFFKGRNMLGRGAR
ncbi:MAG: DUF58 domain-containing protein [Planctomycetota bacterium]|nr:DUF58 domain-containing protein [Planctomycetota bacterium]